MKSARPAHVTVDARMVADGGIGTYLSNLLPRLAARRPDWTFTLLGDPEELSALSVMPNVRTVTCRAGIYGVREQLALMRARPSDADVFWTPHYNVPLATGRAKLVATVHDLCHLALPDQTGGFARRGYARGMFEMLRRRADAVLFDSEFTRSEMERLVGPPPTRSVVAHLGVDESWFRARTDHPVPPRAGPYLLYVGTLKRHKNVPVLLEAFRKVRDRLPTLVIIGRREGLNADERIPDTEALARDGVVFLGEIPHAETRRYVAHATALVTTTLYEGFGLPPLEAMAAGTPCVVSRAGSLPEICGDAAAYCDPRDADDVAEHLAEIVTDESRRRTLIERGRTRARQFSWERCAEVTLATLQRCAS